MKKTKLQPEQIAMLIVKRLKNFWGYGNLKSSIWLIGMEEGLGKNEGFPLERFQVTDGKSVVDITDNIETDHKRWFKSKASTQPTYRKLIYILLYLELKRKPTIEEIRDFQINEFGRTESNHAILELMPLPAKSIKKTDWIYQDMPLIGLTDREEYLASYKPNRVQALRLLIEQYQPKLVLFYSRTYLKDWQSIILPKQFKEVIPGKLHSVKIKNTVYAVTAHPTSRGMKNDDWLQIAKNLYK